MNDPKPKTFMFKPEFDAFAKKKRFSQKRTLSTSTCQIDLMDRAVALTIDT